MAENWSTFKVEPLFPTEIRGVVDAVTTVTGALTEILQLTRTALEFAQQFASAASGNPAEDALRATIDEIEGFIDGLVAQTAAHAIFIPIQKQDFGLTEPRPTTLQPIELTPTIAELLSEGAFSTPPEFETQALINESETAQGGNAGFWRALQTSIQDEGDLNRPNFPTDFAVAGVCIIFGAESFGSLQQNFQLFEQVFEVGNRAQLSGNTRPVAQNVRANTRVTTNTTPARVAVQIDWDALPLVIGLPLYSDEVISVDEIFVVRSTNPSIREKFSWGQVFSREPRDSSSDLQEEGDAKVVARIDNDGFVVRYIDDDETLEENKAYYYALCVRYSIDDEVQPMGNFSNVVRTEFRRPQGTRRSVQPDWWATPSLIALFPELEGLLNTVRLEIAGLGSRTASNSGASAVIGQTITQIDSLIEQGESLLSQIDATASKLTALTQKEFQAATSSTLLSVSTGGMERWMGDLAARMADRSDPTRPPFDDDELVAGIVIVAGAPNLPQLQAFIDLLSLFFGSAEDNPIVDAVSAVEAAAREAETIVFDDTMSASRTTEPVEESAPRVGFDAAMNPVSDPVC